MKPNYYAIIPAEVRYNEKLTANSKLLYGELTALSNKKGYSWAQNKYFADLYNVDTKTISRWIKQLQEESFIKIKIEYDKETKQVTKRLIKISTVGGRDKNVLGGQKDPQGGDKNVQDNIYSNNINNTSNNSATFKKVSDFSDFYINAYNHIIDLFPEEFHPKDTKIKVDWLNVIRLADQKDKVNPRQLYYLIKKAKQDVFWKTVKFGLLSLRKTNSKSGLRRIDQFKLQFKDDGFNLLANNKQNDK